MPDRREAFERELSPEPGRTALVVVDMQRGFLDPGEAMEVPPARETVPVLQTLLELFRARRMPVVFTEFVYSESAPLLVGRLHPEHRPAKPGAPRGFGLPSSSCLEGTRAPTPCPIWSRGRASWSSASGGTTRSPARRSMERCAPAT